MAEGDVVDVEQDFLFALFVPDLPAGVAGVGQDHADRTLGPRQPGPMRVSVPVLRGRARDVVAGQPFSDDRQPGSAEEPGEDPPHDRSGVRVDRQTVQAAVGGLGRVRVRTEIRQLIAIRWASTEEPAFHLRLGGHRGPDPDLDPVPLAL